MADYRDLTETLSSEGMFYRYTEIEDFCNRQYKRAGMYCDGLKFALCFTPERCSPKLTFDTTDPQEDKIANVWQSMYEDENMMPEGTY